MTKLTMFKLLYILKHEFWTILNAIKTLRNKIMLNVTEMRMQCDKKESILKNFGHKSNTCIIVKMSNNHKTILVKMSNNHKTISVLAPKYSETLLTVNSYWDIIFSNKIILHNIGIKRISICSRISVTNWDGKIPPGISRKPFMEKNQRMELEP